MIELVKKIENCFDKKKLSEVLEESGFVGSIKIHVDSEYIPRKIELNHFSKINKD